MKVPEKAVEALARHHYEQCTSFHVCDWENERAEVRAGFMEDAQADLQAAYPAILDDLRERLADLDWQEINTAAEDRCPSREHRPIACAKCVAEAALASLTQEQGR